MFTPKSGARCCSGLVERADVFLSNFREDSLIRMGLGYEDLAAHNDRLVYALANGFGHEGPDRNKRMTDQYAQVRSGISRMIGEPGSAPVIPGTTIGDTSGAMGLTLAIMTALAARELHGIGAAGAHLVLRGDGLDAGLGAEPLVDHRSAPAARGTPPPECAGDHRYLRDGRRRRVPCRDGRRSGLARVLRVRRHLPKSPRTTRWDSFEKRTPMSQFQWVRQSAELRPHVERAMKSRTTEEWEQFFDERRNEVMYQRVFDYEDVMSDPQALENGYIVEKGRPRRGQAPRWRVSSPNSQRHRRAPSPGSRSWASTRPR